MTCPFQLRSQLPLRLLEKMSQDFLTTMSYPNVGTRTKWWLQLLNASNFQSLCRATASGSNLRTEGSWRPEQGPWLRLFLIRPRDVSVGTQHRPREFWMNTSSSPSLQFSHVRDEAQEIQKEGWYSITCLPNLTQIPHNSTMLLSPCLLVPAHLLWSLWDSMSVHMHVHLSWIISLIPWKTFPFVVTWPHHYIQCKGNNVNI